MQWEPFLVFYWVDGVVTAAIKVVWNWVNRKFHTNDNIQVCLILIGCTIITIVLSLSLPFSSISDSAYLLMFCLGSYGPLVLSIIWKRVHIWLDPELALSGTKRYTEGYYAWSYVIISIIVFGVGLRLHSYVTTWALLGAGISYSHFGRRHTRGEDRKKRRVSEALRELLRRYRAITQRPRLA